MKSRLDRFLLGIMQAPVLLPWDEVREQRTSLWYVMLTAEGENKHQLSRTALLRLLKLTVCKIIESNRLSEAGAEPL